MMQDIFTLALSLIKLIVAVLAGWLIGRFPLPRNQIQGASIHILSATGACMLMILSSTVMVGNSGFMAIFVIVGIGCLCGLMILVERGSTPGTATAVSLWVASIIGLGIGLGLFVESVFATLLVYLVLENLSE